MINLNYSPKTSVKQHAGKRSNLAYILACRQAELTRILAACAATDPAGVLPLIARLDSDDLLDEHARSFLERLKPDDGPESIVALAHELGYLKEYCAWFGSLPWLYDGTAADLAAETVKEIQKIVISRQALKDLSTYIRGAARVGEWRGVSWAS